MALLKSPKRREPEYCHQTMQDKCEQHRINLVHFLSVMMDKGIFICADKTVTKRHEGKDA